IPYSDEFGPEGFVHVGGLKAKVSRHLFDCLPAPLFDGEDLCKPQFGPTLLEDQFDESPESHGASE
ncbi:hypothetical protein, partial [Bradyrhizobium sp. sGM-13]|uniref:hypothetical protein n=1 Tax=Bradyrhizobium sp. sGM-13 TaxID=2831781 RepID=UPI001BCF4E4B